MRIPGALRQEIGVAAWVVIAMLGVVGKGIAAEDVPVRHWMVYYSDVLPPEAFYPYDPVVFDSNSHPLLSPLKDRGKTLLGYLSLGEVERFRPWFDELKRNGLLLMENKNWPGSYFVDLRNPRWTQLVIDELVPKILFHGFDGVFLDTLDNASELERIDPKRYKGMADAAVHLVRAIRRHYPEIKLMLNRAFELLPQLGNVVDIALAESTYAGYDFKNKRYQRIPDTQYAQYVAVLKDVKARFPHLQIFALDYWDPEDKEGVKAIYDAQRANGFSPLVSTIKLDRIVAQPEQR